MPASTMESQVPLVNEKNIATMSITNATPRRILRLESGVYQNTIKATEKPKDKVAA